MHRISVFSAAANNVFFFYLFLCRGIKHLQVNLKLVPYGPTDKKSSLIQVISWSIRQQTITWTGVDLVSYKRQCASVCCEKMTLYCFPHTISMRARNVHWQHSWLVEKHPFSEFEICIFFWKTTRSCLSPYFQNVHNSYRKYKVSKCFLSAFHDILVTKMLLHVGISPWWNTNVQ